MNLVNRRFLVALVAFAPGLVLSAATYLPMSDTDLVRQAPIVARATVTTTSVHLESIAGVDRPITLVTLQLLEAIKGSPGETFVVRLPGGSVGDAAWWIPGTPAFSPGQDVVLMLGPQPGEVGQFRLTEFGLSKFDLVSDDTGRKFAVRPAFAAGDDLLVAKRAPESGGPFTAARDAESFLAFLRSMARGEAAAEAVLAAPLTSRAKWTNIGGREPGLCDNGQPCLWRWYWDSTPGSPNAVLSVNGTQSNLHGSDEPACGTDSVCDVQNASAAWHAVAATDIRVSGPTTPGNITVNLDSTMTPDGTTWTTSLGCEGGTIGLGGPGNGYGPGLTFKGDTPYYYPRDGTVSMRKVTCSSGYSAATFRSAVLHEVGHVLGLNHPDQAVSIHSTTTEDDWAHAVMHSVITQAKPDVPQTDDIQAMQYYYGTAAVGAAPTADFTFSPATPTAGSPVSFSDASTGSPTGWNWDFGDPHQGTVGATTQNASHVFSGPGTFSVRLTAGNLNGSAFAQKTITVAPGATTCTVDQNTLCLGGGRFQTTIAWSKSDGSSGLGRGVPLTPESGYFWFFSATNIEAVVKVLNGCGVDGYYWVFLAGLTDVGVTMTVVDTQNGTQKQYFNTEGTPFAPTQDTKAFATCP